MTVPPAAVTVTEKVGVPHVDLANRHGAVAAAAAVTDPAAGLGPIGAAATVNIATATATDTATEAVTGTVVETKSTGRTGPRRRRNVPPPAPGTHHRQVPKVGNASMNCTA